MTLILIILVIALLLERRQFQRRQSLREMNALAAIEAELRRNLSRAHGGDVDVEALNYRTSIDGGALATTPLDLLALIVSAYGFDDPARARSEVKLQAALTAIDRHLILYGGRKTT